MYFISHAHPTQSVMFSLSAVRWLLGPSGKGAVINQPCLTLAWGGSGIGAATHGAFTNVYCKNTKNSSIHGKEYLQQGLSYDSSYSFYTYFPHSLPCSVPRKADPVDCFLHVSLLSGFCLHSTRRRPWQIRRKRAESCRHFFPAFSLLWCCIQTTIYKIY